MDTAAHHARGRQDRPGDHRVGRSHHEGEAPSRAGLPIVSGHHGLVKTYGTARVEAASQRGNDIGATTYGSIASILKTGLDKAYANANAPDGPPIRHANIRGRGYYH